MNKGLEKLEVNPTGTAVASVIWLHGLGADGHDFVDIVPQLKLPADLPVRFVFPHAPVRSVTLNMGYRMRAWFDVYGLDENSPQDEQGINTTEQLVQQLIVDEQNLGIPNDKIVLAGFSQGGAMALHCGLHYFQKLAGILVLSGFLPLASSFEKSKNMPNHETPILMMHGQYDNVVPVKWAELSREKLVARDYRVEWSTYPIDHGVCIEEIMAVSSWLKKILH